MIYSDQSRLPLVKINGVDYILDGRTADASAEIEMSPQASPHHTNPVTVEDNPIRHKHQPIFRISKNPGLMASTVLSPISPSRSSHTSDVSLDDDLSTTESISKQLSDPNNVIEFADDSSSDGERLLTDNKSSKRGY